MQNKLPNVHLDMYGDEFRKGYDCAVVVGAMRTFLERAANDDSLEAIFVRIHKVNSSFVEGVLSENLFQFEYKMPNKVDVRDGEVWLRIRPLQGRNQ